MSDSTLARATIAAALIESKRFAGFEGIEVYEANPDTDWRTIPSLVRFRRIVDAIYLSLYEDTVGPRGGGVRKATWG